MPDFIGATISFGVILSVKDKDKLKKDELIRRVSSLLMNETEWIGEPKSSNGCIISMNPKEFKINGEEVEKIPGQTELFQENEESTKEEEEIEEEPVDQSFVMIVKAVRRGDEVKLLKKPDEIAEALAQKEGYTLILKTKTKGMKFASIETMIGVMVGYVDKKGELILKTVGKR